MKMTSSNRFAVRTALVTGTTLATIIGAQALVSVDAATFSQTPLPVVAPGVLGTQPTGTASLSQPNVDVPAAAPRIVILRHVGQAPGAQKVAPPNTSTENLQSVTIEPVTIEPVTIQPPGPVQVTVPQPAPQVFVPFVPRTRSSR